MSRPVLEVISQYLLYACIQPGDMYGVGVTSVEEMLPCVVHFANRSGMTL
jgi:hypothetical protein